MAACSCTSGRATWVPLKTRREHAQEGRRRQLVEEGDRQQPVVHAARRGRPSCRRRTTCRCRPRRACPVFSVTLSVGSPSSMTIVYGTGLNTRSSARIATQVAGLARGPGHHVGALVDHASRSRWTSTPRNHRSTPSAETAWPASTTRVRPACSASATTSAHADRVARHRRACGRCRCRCRTAGSRAGRRCRRRPAGTGARCRRRRRPRRRPWAPRRPPRAAPARAPARRRCPRSARRRDAALLRDGGPRRARCRAALPLPDVGLSSSTTRGALVTAATLAPRTWRAHRSAAERVRPDAQVMSSSRGLGRRSSGSTIGSGRSETSSSAHWP